MFHKIIKRGSRRHHSKSYDNEPTVWKSDQLSTSGVTVNHASHTMVSSMVVNSLQQPGPERAPATGTSDSVIVQTPLFKDAPSSDHQVLFLRKLQICCNIFDFSDTFMSVREKEIKRHTLLELVEFIQANAGKISEKAHEELIRMISVNIFRCFPPSAHDNAVIDNFDPEEVDSFQEPSWIHLQIVYELLFRYIASPEVDTKIGKRYINHLFVSKLIDLFDSEDHREREYLKTILHRIYGKFMVHRPFIRKTISNIFYRFVFEVERHSGISELLEILGSIINGFAFPMKEEHKLFLSRALIPLHKPKCLAVYHHQLSYCVTQFVEKDSSLADVVIRGLLKFWPVVNCQKEILFLTELEEVLEVTQSSEFQRCMVPLFKQIGRCLNSSHFQVAERTLFLWNNDHIISLIAQNRSIIFPILFAPLEKNMKGHWNQVVHGLTTNVWKMFQEMDSDLFEECQRQQEEKEPKVKSSQEQRQEAWRRLEDAVAAKDAMY